MTPRCSIFGKTEPLTKLLKRLWEDEEGQDLAEYALLLGLVALGAIATMHGLATTINNMFLNAATSVATSTGG